MKTMRLSSVADVSEAVDCKKCSSCGEHVLP